MLADQVACQWERACACDHGVISDSEPKAGPSLLHSNVVLDSAHSVLAQRRYTAVSMMRSVTEGKPFCMRKFMDLRFDIYRGTEKVMWHVFQLGLVPRAW